MWAHPVKRGHGGGSVLGWVLTLSALVEPIALAVHLEEVVHHTIRFAVSIADRPGDSCLAAMTETALVLDLDCRIEAA